MPLLNVVTFIWHTYRNELLFFDGTVLTGKFCVGVPLNIQSIYLSWVEHNLHFPTCLHPPPPLHQKNTYIQATTTIGQFTKYRMFGEEGFSWSYGPHFEHHKRNQLIGPCDICDRCSTMLYWYLSHSA